MIKKIIIVDYGVGNLYSLKRALGKCGVKAIVSEEANDIESADALVLPGVGSFGAGMRGLRVRGLTDIVKTAAQKGRPILGICLGAQLMLEKGYEFGEFEGLGIFKGDVVRFGKECSEKIPHIGWNEVREGKSGMWKDTIFGSLKSGFAAYFVHSYILRPRNADDIFGVTEYGGCQFASVLRKGAIYACQFHPEKSGPAGLILIQSFVNSV